MRDALRAVPGLYWVALAWTALAAWAGDVRGIYVAVVFLVLGTVQLSRSGD